MARLTAPASERHQGVHVELRDISKSFGGTHALEGVSLAIGHGSIHALVGENGAGKSTLGKIISGVHSPDHGQLLLAGEPVRFRSPRDAISRGVILIAQELATVPSLTVAENVFLGVEPRQAGFQNRRELRRRYTELAASVGFELDGDANVGRLRTADQQKVEILRALCRNAQLIVMDEPTAALSRSDAEALHLVVRQLARSGTTVVLVSHFLNEVLELADEVTILRDGRLVQTVPAAGQTEDSLLSRCLADRLTPRSRRGGSSRRTPRCSCRSAGLPHPGSTTSRSTCVPVRSSAWPAWSGPAVPSWRVLSTGRTGFVPVRSA